MYQKTFVCLCRRTVNPINTIFNTVHVILDMNNIFKFQNIWRIFTRVRACADGQTDRRTIRQTNRMHKHFSTLLESVKNKILGNQVMDFFWTWFKEESFSYKAVLKSLLNDAILSDVVLSNILMKRD